jgi:hypothetical protein
LKDLLELVATFVAGQPAAQSKKWWIAIAVTPFDAEPLGFTTGTTKHQVNVSHDPFRTAVTLCIDGETAYDDAKEKTFAALLARLEKKHRVTYRLDRAQVSGSPVPLKKAVSVWLGTVRGEARPANAFEAIAATKGVNENTIARWVRLLEGGAGYDLKLEGFAKLLADETFIEVARAFLDGVRDVPADWKKGYKRNARIMSLLVKHGDARSLAIARRFLARTKKSLDATSYAVDFAAARR